MNIYINNRTDYYSPILYVLWIIERNKNIRFNLINEKYNADLIFDHTNPKSQPIALSFYNALSNSDSNFSHKKYFPEQQFIQTPTGEIDYPATIFYMINCLQELNPATDELDGFGRFKFEMSYQKRFNSIENNLVQHSIDALVKSWGISNTRNFKSAFFLSHDIDTIYGSLLQDGFWAFKKGRFDIILGIIANEFIRKPHWRNIDKIIKIHLEYDIKSTFFWLVNKGKGELNIKNADYSISKEKDLLYLVQQHGFVNGLHKSCSSVSINDEINKHPAKPESNRYHFLKFLPQNDWQKINDSSLNFDSSLGFAERYGFRNSFGMPFQPYNLKEKKPYNFVEAPMNFMDGTFHKYLKIPVNDVAKLIIEFYEKNSNNCVFSICWHNVYFTNYKYSGFINQYKKILSFIYENKIECLTPEEIIKKVKLS